MLQIIAAGPETHFLWYNRWENRNNKKDEKSPDLLHGFFDWSQLSPDMKRNWSVDNAKEQRTNFTGSRWISDELRDLFVEFVQGKNLETLKAARELRRKRRDQAKENALEKLKTDDRYRDLYGAIADLFAKQLLAERQRLEDGKANLSGLAAKWAPSPRGSHDRHTGGIVEKMYPVESYCVPGGAFDDYLSFMTDAYRKELSRQRRAAYVPEHFIGRGEWQLVDYKRMPSLCRQKHGHIFQKHDKTRYDEFLDAAKAQVDQGEEQTLIKAGVLLPIDIIYIARHGSTTQREEANLQWLRLVQDTRASGNIPSALAIADVSGSMTLDGKEPRRPIDVAIAMAMLISDVANEP